MKGLIAALVVLLAVGVFFFYRASPTSAPAEMTEAEIAQIEAEVLEWADLWVESSRSQDADAVVALMDPDEARYVVNSTFHSGLDDCRDALETLYQGWETWAGEWSGESVEALGPEVAFLIGQVRGPLTLVGGTEGINQVRLSFLLRKRVDGWKAVYGHGSGTFTPNPVEEG